MAIARLHSRQMTDEGTPPGPPRFPPVEEPPSEPPGWPPPGSGWPPTDQHGNIPPGSLQGGPSGHWLHPLDVGRTFSSSWRLFRLRWRPMVAAILVVSLPVAVLSAVIQGYVVSTSMQDWLEQYFAAVRAGEVSNLPLPPASFGLTYVIGILSGILGMIANAAVINIVDASYRGSTSTAGQALRAAFGRTLTFIGIFAALIGVFLAVALIGLLLITALVVVGALLGDAGLTILLSLIGAVGLIAAIIFFALRWSLAPQVVMVEGAGALKSLGRSWRLIDGSTWRLLGYYLLLALIFIGYFLVVGLIVGGLQLLLFGPGFRIENGQIVALFNPLALVFSTVLSALALAIISPLWVTVLTLFYFDLRWRRGEPLPNAATAPAVAA